MRMRPFSSGSELGAWRDHNCHHCALYNAERFDGACEIDGAIGEAYIGDGQVTAEIAKRMGFTDGLWECPERQSREAVPA